MTAYVNNNKRLEFNVIYLSETFEMFNLAVRGLTTLRHRLPIRLHFYSYSVHIRPNDAVVSVKVASRCSRRSACQPDVWRQNWQLLSVYYHGKRAWPSLELPYTVISNPLLQSPLMIVALYLSSTLLEALRHWPSIWP